VNDVSRRGSATQRRDVSGRLQDGRPCRTLRPTTRWHRTRGTYRVRWVSVEYHDWPNLITIAPLRNVPHVMGHHRR
jgi:hypothetical protein